MNKDIEKIKEQLSVHISEATAAEVEFQRVPQGDFAIERKVVANRLEAARLVLGRSADSVEQAQSSLAKYLSEFNKPGDTSSVATGTSSGVAMTKAGPCPGQRGVKVLWRLVAYEIVASV